MSYSNSGYGGGYDQYNPGNNIYNQRDESPRPGLPSGPAMGARNYGAGSNVEMTSLIQNPGGFGQSDPNAILNECQAIDQGIQEIENNLNQLRMLQDRSLNDSDTSSGSATSRQLDGLSSETMTLYRSLTDRVRTVKSSPDARNPRNTGHIGRVDRRLKQAIQQYQQVESAFRKKTQDQMARQYRIVRPDADEREVRAAVEDTSGGQVFSQALMQSGRQGQARQALSAVQDRHVALQKIEQQMVELAQLFQDMDTLVVQQEAAVTQIEQKGEEVVENLDKGNEEIGVAVVTARKTRKKKWWCLGISVAIILIIVIIVVIYFLVIKGPPTGNKKRGIEFIEDFSSLPIVNTVPISGSVSQVTKEKFIRPALNFAVKPRYVVPGIPYDGGN